MCVGFPLRVCVGHFGALSVDVMFPLCVVFCCVVSPGGGVMSLGDGYSYPKDNDGVARAPCASGAISPLCQLSNKSPVPAEP